MNRCGHCGGEIPKKPKGKSGHQATKYCSRACCKKAVQLRFHHRRLAGTVEESERGKRVAREYRERNRGAGRCTRCGSEDRAPGRVLCRSCNTREL